MAIQSPPADLTALQIKGAVPAQPAIAQNSSSRNPVRPPVQEAPRTIVLPIEVIGLDGTIKSVLFDVPHGIDLSGLSLRLRIHGLRFQAQASLQVNGIAWQPINESTATLLGLARNYGGIGGGFHTFTLTMPVNALQPGTNMVSFRFNGTDGRVSGFRVLEFNVQDANGNLLISSRSFVYDDPKTWRPISTDPSDISAGEALWKGAPLTVPRGSAPASPIRAHCSDCHAQDGRDLKYFNYSNLSITTRSMFHGLTQIEGDQIASYIRSLNSPSPGRPWNPPYQPGPGLDSKPVSDWSAGAGIDAVLERDSAMLGYLMPGGSTATWGAGQYLNAREMPLALQLADWNSWLPDIHPLDAWGSTFTESTLYSGYLQVRAQLKPGDIASYQGARDLLWLWSSRDQAFTLANVPEQSDRKWQDPNFVDDVYSTQVWSMVKLWEINQEFGLEGMAQSVFGTQAAARAWYTNYPFFASPFMTHIPRPSVGLDNGTAIVHRYLSWNWYQTQLILNDGNHAENPRGVALDWAYSVGYPANDLSWYASDGPVGLTGLMSEWMVKALQNAPDNTGNPRKLINFPTQISTWMNVSPPHKVEVMNDYVEAWFAKYKGYTSASGLYANVTGDPGQVNFQGDLFYAIPQLRYQGVDISLLSQITKWAAGLWPSLDWAADLATSCSTHNQGQITCP